MNRLIETRYTGKHCIRKVLACIFCFELFCKLTEDEQLAQYVFAQQSL